MYQVFKCLPSNPYWWVDPLQSICKTQFISDFPHLPHHKGLRGYQGKVTSVYKYVRSPVSISTRSTSNVLVFNPLGAFYHTKQQPVDLDNSFGHTLIMLPGQYFLLNPISEDP